MTTTGPSPLGALLVSLQLTDSAFPSGMYTMSHGLEGFRQMGLVEGADLEELLTDLLVASVGPGDATAFARAHDAASRQDWVAVEHIDRLLFAAKLNEELRTASTRSGRQVISLGRKLFAPELVDTYADLIRARRVPGCQPVASAVIYAAAGVEVDRAVTSDLFAFVASYAGAAMRLRLTDHEGAQHLIRSSATTVETVAAEAVARSVADLGGYAPMSDIASAHHQHSDGRLFTT
ncbi:urease accessory protein UreF [Gordonia jinghuaiqii]|nr:urease accessory UreF family protein [Gordonia jinghuaiqii]